MKVTEEVIRDHLAARLELVEEGLVLLKTEAYLPSKEGSKGFVDILARDQKGRFVLIELKRTNAAAREAIHEVLKYVESTKTHLAVEEGELRVFVVSVEWHELLVPFSAFAAESRFSIAGVQLVVDEGGVPTSARRVEPLPITAGRLFAPWHELRLYDSVDRMTGAMADFASSCKEKGIHDYVVVEMRAEEHHTAAELQRRLAAIAQISATYGDGEGVDEIPLGLESETVGLLYFAMLQMADSHCMETIEELGDTDDVEEFIESIEDASGDALSCRLHEKILDVGKSVRHDGYEIGYPAKFAAFDQSDEWELVSVHRFGALARNELLSDDTILSELRGEKGITRQRYVKVLDRPDQKEIRRLREDVEEVFRDNPQWSGQVKKVFDQVEKDGDIEELKISILNPCNTLLHLFLFIQSGDSNYLPSLGIEITRGAATVVYGGCLVPTGTKPSLKYILDENYEGTAAAALMSLNWGGYEDGNAKVTRDAGLAYATFELDSLAARGDEGGRVRRLTDLGFEPSDRSELGKLLSHYFPANKPFIHDFVRMFGESWNGVFVDYSNADDFRPST